MATQPPFPALESCAAGGGEPFEPPGAALLFHLLIKLYEHSQLNGPFMGTRPSAFVPERILCESDDRFTPFLGTFGLCSSPARSGHTLVTAQSKQAQRSTCSCASLDQSASQGDECRRKGDKELQPGHSSLLLMRWVDYGTRAMQALQPVAVHVEPFGRRYS